MNKRFPSRLAAVIRAMGMNPTDFARKARIPQGTISKCLSGHVPTARILLRISKLSGRSVDWLLTGKEPVCKKAGAVAERPARYGRSRTTEKRSAEEQVWVDKLLKVLRSQDSRRKEMAKKLLDVLSP